MSHFGGYDVRPELAIEEDWCPISKSTQDPARIEVYAFKCLIILPGTGVIKAVQLTRVWA